MIDKTGQTFEVVVRPDHIETASARLIEEGKVGLKKDEAGVLRANPKDNYFLAAVSECAFAEFFTTDHTLCTVGRNKGKVDFPFTDIKASRRGARMYAEFLMATADSVEHNPATFWVACAVDLEERSPVVPGCTVRFIGWCYEDAFEQAERRRYLGGQLILCIPKERLHKMTDFHEEWALFRAEFFRNEDHANATRRVSYRTHTWVNDYLRSRGDRPRESMELFAS